jgi:uncharacterized protein
MPKTLARLLALLVLLWTTAAFGFQPPPLRGHVVDPAGALTSAEARRLDAKLDEARRTTGFALVVFIPASLEGESIEDVGYTTAKTWRVGSEEADDGVVLLIAPAERKVRIETGKGLGGALTDLESSHIIRDAIAPRMKEGNTYAAVEAGTDRILAALASGTPGRVSPAGTSERSEGDGSPFIALAWLVGAYVVPMAAFALVARLVRRRRRAFGTTGDAVSSRSSEPSSSSSSSDGSGGSGYTGGGGDFGGGGASGDY